ncbi:GDNF family receptor alpha-like isoform 2-T2 [Odontesthes bonariensis]
MSDLCKCERAFYSGNCEDEGCQIKGSVVCNITIQTALDQFPSLRGCVCAWEEELCDSIQVLASQCPRKPAIQQQRSTVMDWKSSSLNIAYRGSGSCVHRIGICVSDSVCNRHLAPVLQACMAEQCESDLCEKETQQFYGNMPQNAAEMLVMCECEASDQSCLLMKTGLQTGRCGDETRICQERLDQCVEDSNCRDLLKTLQAKCWSREEAQCSDKNLQRDGCFTLRDPALILGTCSECRRAFLATLGTVLHHPCTCKGVHSDHLLTCRMIQDVFHNRSHFITFRERSDGASKPHEINGSEHGYTWSHDHLLYAFAALIFAGVIIIISLAAVCKFWLLRSRDQTNLCHPRRRNCVVVL